MPKGIPLTDAEQSRKRHEIFAAAQKLFIANGFVETPMREIARAAGMGKSSLYDYFRSKDEILFWFFQDEFDDLIAMARDIANQPLPVIEKLHRILVMQMERMLGYRKYIFKLYFELQRLGGESEQIIHAKRHDYQDILCGVIEQGIREGEFRPVNPLLATHMLQMTLLPVIYTMRPVGTPEGMLEESFSLFLRGVQN